jgi:hypothetical protein
MASARSVPQEPPKPPPQPATPGLLLAPLAVPEPAQPARLATKQPPPVRLSILGFGRVSVAVGAAYS